MTRIGLAYVKGSVPGFEHLEIYQLILLRRMGWLMEIKHQMNWMLL